MISVSFFLHPNRQENLKTIHDAYKDYDIVDEVLVVTGKEVDTNNCDPKFKFVHMPGPYTYGEWPSFGLLSRYTFALSCKNRYVFIQDDDWVYNEDFFNKVISTEQPIAGVHGRWFENGKYIRKKDKSLNTAPIVLTSGVLIDTKFLPKVIEYAKEFWSEYQNVFNGEDIFMSLVISEISKIKEFPIFTNKKYYKSLNTEGKELSKDVNSSKDRTEITKNIYNFLETKK